MVPVTDAVWVSMAGIVEASTLTVCDCRSDVELNVESVRLIADQFDIVDDLLLEALRFHFQPEACGGGQCIEVEHAGFIADPNLGLAGCGIGQREGGA